MAGRLHYYEGYTTQEVIFPIRSPEVPGDRDLINK
jgi:hypothetical protein